METLGKVRVRTSQHGYNRTAVSKPQRLKTIPKRGLVTDAQVVKVLSNNLASLRIQRGMTQRRVSELTGILLSSIGAYEEGRCEPPMQRLLLLAALFGVTLSQLVLPTQHD